MENFLTNMDNQRVLAVEIQRQPRKVGRAIAMPMPGSSSSSWSQGYVAPVVQNIVPLDNGNPPSVVRVRVRDNDYDFRIHRRPRKEGWIEYRKKIQGYEVTLLINPDDINEHELKNFPPPKYM